MSNTNGMQTLAKSMNGLIEFSDGSGTTISDGDISVDAITSNSLNVSGSAFINNLTVGSFTFVTEIFGKYQFVDFVFSGIDTVSTTYYSILDNVKNISFGSIARNLKIGLNATNLTIGGLTNLIIGSNICKS